MPTALNFDTLSYDTVEIEKRGQKWTLRDDIPTKIIMRCFAFGNLSERLQQAAQAAQDEHPDDYEAAGEALQAYYADEERRAANIVGDIFRHTDPSISDETLLTTFSFEELMGIANLFFTLHSRRSSQQPADSSAPSTASTPATSQQTKNRAQRRAATAASGKRS